MAVMAATPEGVRGEHATVPLAGQSRARLVFPRSVARMHLTAGGTDALFEGRFSPPFPTVRAEGEVVTVEFRRVWGFLRRPQPTTITLHPLHRFPDKEQT